MGNARKPIIIVAEIVPDNTAEILRRLAFLLKEGAGFTIFMCEDCRDGDATAQELRQLLESAHYIVDIETRPIRGDRDIPHFYDACTSIGYDMQVSNADAIFIICTTTTFALLPNAVVQCFGVQGTLPRFDGIAGDVVIIRLDDENDIRANQIKLGNRD